MDAPYFRRIIAAVVIAGCGTDNDAPDTETGASSGDSTGRHEVSTSGRDASSTAAPPGDPSTGTSTSSDLETSTGPASADDSTSTGAWVPPVVDDAAHFRGLVELRDGTVLEFDAIPAVDINVFNGLHVCEASATIEAHDVEVHLSWPDTSSLELGEQSWSIISDQGLQLTVGIDGPLGDETSLSTAGSVTLVDVGADTPLSVAGVAELDLDPGGDGDLLQSMTMIEFRCPLGLRH